MTSLQCSVMCYFKPYLELVLATWILISCCYKWTVSIEGVVETIKGSVVWVTITLTHTVTAMFRWNTSFTLAHQARGTEAAWDAGALLWTLAFIIKSLTLLLTLWTEAILVDLPRTTFLICEWWDSDGAMKAFTLFSATVNSQFE